MCVLGFWLKLWLIWDWASGNCGILGGCLGFKAVILLILWCLCAQLFLRHTWWVPCLAAYGWKLEASPSYECHWMAVYYCFSHMTVLAIHFDFNQYLDRDHFQAFACCHLNFDSEVAVLWVYFWNLSRHSVHGISVHGIGLRLIESLWRSK